MKTRTKLFFILWIVAVITSILIIPYLLNLESGVIAQAGISSSYFIVLVIIQSIVIFGIAAFHGLILAEKTGFKLPLLTSWIEHKKIKYIRTLILSIILGLIAGAVIVILDKFLFNQALSLTKVPLWQGFLASFYGGISEEIFMRLFLLSFFVFVIMKIDRTKANPIIIWVSIILVSILFGLGHLPITAAVTTITPWIVFRAILLNGIGGVVFGWLYWKKGLESAIISHFFGDIVIQIIAPVLLGA